MAELGDIVYISKKIEHLNETKIPWDDDGVMDRCMKNKEIFKIIQDEGTWFRLAYVNKKTPVSWCVIKECVSLTKEI